MLVDDHHDTYTIRTLKHINHHQPLDLHVSMPLESLDAWSAELLERMLR